MIAIRGPVHWAPVHRNHSPLAKPNYSFEKLQRELAKKKKKEEKLARKQDARGDSPPAADSGAPQDAPAGSGENG